MDELTREYRKAIAYLRSAEAHKDFPATYLRLQTKARIALSRAEEQVRRLAQDG